MIDYEPASASCDGNGYVLWLTCPPLISWIRGEMSLWCPLLSVLRRIVPEVRRKKSVNCPTSRLGPTTAAVLTFFGVPSDNQRGNGPLPKIGGFDRKIIYTRGIFHCLNARGSSE